MAALSSGFFAHIAFAPTHFALVTYNAQRSLLVACIGWHAALKLPCAARISAHRPEEIRHVGHQPFSG